MLLSRPKFFAYLFLLLCGPLIGPRLFWLAGTRHSTGVVAFIGHGNIESPFGISTYPVILFQLGRDSIFFNGMNGLGYKPGDQVPVRYRVGDPADAKIDQPICLWGGVLVNLLFPVLVWLVIILTPKRFDPLVPRGSKILLRRKRPYIKIIPAGSHRMVNICSEPVNYDTPEVGWL